MQKKIVLLTGVFLFLISVYTEAVSESIVLTQTVYAAQEGESVELSDLLDMKELTGWASVKGEGLETTIGGNNTEIKPVIVSTKDEFAKAVSDDIPRIVVVSGEVISMTSGEKQKGGYPIDIGSNKTIVGIDQNATLYGGISIKNKNNIIVSNLNIHGVWPYTGPSDTIGINNSHHIWLNHLNVWNSKDGSIDTTLGSDYITVSWCKLWYEDVICEWDTTDGTQGKREYKKGETAYAVDHGHRLACLVGSGAGDHDDTDMGRLRVTFHHNWFADYVKERMPRVMYGRAHIYNNYYSCKGNYYCIGVDSHAAVLVENNYFENVNDPHIFNYPQHGFLGASITARGNQYVNITGYRKEGQKNDTLVTEYKDTNYSYYLNAADDAKKIVISYAGPRSYHILGDVNKDQKTDLFDVQLVLKAALHIIELDSSQEKAADVNQSGEITVEDAQLLLKHILKINILKVY